MHKKSKFILLFILLLSGSFLSFQVEAAKKSKLKGILYSVDTTAKTITIKNQSNAHSTITLLGESGNSVSLLVTADTVIEREDEPAGLSELQVGDRAETEFNTVTMIATFIKAEDDGDDD